jgi:TM2 domain-containing membrane protein YozV
MNDNKVIIAPILAWLVPGLGHVYLGRRAKAALFGVTILAVFVAGIVLCSGHAVSWSREPLWFLGEAGALGPTILAALVTGGAPWDHVGEHHHVGLLYATVAGLLNLVVAMDAFGIALAASRGGKS